MRLLIGTLLCILFLWILFRGTDWLALQAAMQQVQVSWLVIAFACIFLSLFARVQRWSYVVRALQPASYRSMFIATQTGMLVNSLTPARLGDLVRAAVFSKSENIPLTGSLTMVMLDRVSDVIALITVLLFTLTTLPANAGIEFPPETFGNADPIVISSELIRPVTISLTSALLVLVLTLVLLYFNSGLVLRVLGKLLTPISAKLAAWVDGLFRNFADGMHVFRSPVQLAFSVAWSYATWGLVALSIYALLKGFNIEVNWQIPLIMLGVLGVFTSVTVTPGMIGQYHIPFVAALLMVLPGQNVDQAKAAAIFSHLVNFLPVVLMGVYCMISEKLKLSELMPEWKKNTDI